MLNKLTYILAFHFLFLSTNFSNGSTASPKLNSIYESSVVVSGAQNKVISLSEQTSFTAYDLEDNSEIKDFGKLSIFNPLFIAPLIKSSIAIHPHSSLISLIKPTSKQFILTFTLRI